MKGIKYSLRSKLSHFLCGVLDLVYLTISSVLNFEAYWLIKILAIDIWLIVAPSIAFWLPKLACSLIPVFKSVSQPLACHNPYQGWLLISQIFCFNNLPGGLQSDESYWLAWQLVSFSKYFWLNVFPTSFLLNSTCDVLIPRLMF